MDTYVVKVDKKLLEQFDEDDRVLLLSFAHFANELRALQKLALWSMPKSSLSDPENDGQATLLFMFLKLVAGKLNEANSLVKRKLDGTASGRKLVASLPPDAKEALANIKKHFGGGGVVNKVRNLDAFHYRTGEVKLNLAQVPDEMNVYLQRETNVNNLYYFAEALAVRAIFVKIGMETGETEKGLTQLEYEIGEVSHWFTILSDEVLVAIVRKYGGAIWETTAERVTLGPLTAFDEIRVPWFVDAEHLSRSAQEAE